MKPFKAYIVSDDEESVVCYAQHAVVARRDGAYELDEDFSYVTCRRAPEFDAMFPKGPTDLQKFEHGWRFECSLCSFRSVYEDCGMHSEGRFFCSSCIDGFTEMRPVRTPEFVQRFFGGDLMVGADGNWHDVPVPISRLPLPNRGVDSPYTWFNPFR